MIERPIISKSALASALVFFVATSTSSASAQQDHAGHDHTGHDHAGQELGHTTHQTAPNDAPSHDAPSHREPEGAGHDGGDAHGHGHVPHFSDINWFHGLIGEKEGVEPGLLWRPPGTPIPLGALIINTAILFFLIGRFGGPGIRQGLIDRKERIAGDIEKAAKMKAEAEEQLAYYEEKLAKMEAEMTRIKNEMQEQAEADRERIIREAKERRTNIEGEARKLIQQELAQARHEATLRAVTSAVAAAKAQIESNVSSADHDRLSKEFLGSLESEVKKVSDKNPGALS